MPAVTQPEAVGSFRILSKLGQGGMGTVYQAVHGTLERPVALKILPAEFAHNTEYVMRFLREARTIAALRHENVVQVYDAGEANGQYFIAMELVDGCNLLKHAEDKGKIDPGEGLALLLQAAKGLAAAHAKGLVHRDIKPENLLLGKDNVLRIVDFGLVMESSSTTQLTATGACLGTPMYMSPEQADGEQADARTDLYALGVTFYRIFTGQAPFTSGTVMNLLFKHKFEAPPVPKTLRADLPEDISQLLLHLMAKRREDRPQSAQALIEMIETIKSGKHIPPAPLFVPSAPAAASATLVLPQPSARQARPLPVLPLIVAALVLIGVLVIALMMLTGRDAARPGGSATVRPPDQSLAERGDAAFSSGRYPEALESYREALIETPGDTVIADKIRRTERAMQFQDAMQKGKTAESKGELDEAVARYSEAEPLDEGTSARQHLSAVQERIKHNSQLNSSSRRTEREQHSKLAREAERNGEYEVAAEHYSRAAELSDGSERAAFADKAGECRRQQYLKQARSAEASNDLPKALAMYRHALRVKPDALVEEKVSTLQRTIKEAENAADIDRRYRSALAAGDAAMARGDYRQARVHLGEAMGLKPQLSEPVAKLEALDKLETQGTPVTNPAATAAAAGARRSALALVRAGKDDEALSEIIKALQSDPNNAELRSTKDALKALQFCAGVYADLLKHGEAASAKVRDLLDLDDDDANDRMKTRLQKLREQLTEKSSKPRQLLLDGDCEAVKACVKGARTDARSLADALTSMAETCNERAEKADDKFKAKLGPLEFNLGGEDKKAGPYRKAAELFRKLASQAKEPSN